MTMVIVMMVMVMVMMTMMMVRQVGGEWQLSSASMTNFPRQLTAQFPPHDFSLIHVDI